MNRRLFRYGAAAVFFLLFVTPQVCLANPIAMDPTTTGLIIGGIILFDAVVDLIVLAVSFALLGEFRHFVSRKFLIYFPIVVIGGLVIDWVGLSSSHGELTAGWIIAVMLAVYNAFLCWTFFRISLEKVVCISLVMAILTNPILWMPILEHLPF